LGARDVTLTEDLMRAAFELAEAVVACELRARPDRALQVAKAVLADLPTGPSWSVCTPATKPSCVTPWLWAAGCRP